MKKLRNFVKLDDNNQFVQGSNIKRSWKPLKDRWYEIFPPNCCEVSAPAGTPSGTFTIVSVICGDEILAELSIQSTNLEVVAEMLNAAYPAFGTWSSDGTELVLESQICPNLSISLRYASAPAQGTTTSTTTTSTSTSSTTTSTTSTSTTTV